MEQNSVNVPAMTILQSAQVHPGGGLQYVQPYDRSGTEVQLVKSAHIRGVPCVCVGSTAPLKLACKFFVPGVLLPIQTLPECVLAMGEYPGGHELVPAPMKTTPPTGNCPAKAPCPHSARRTYSARILLRGWPSCRRVPGSLTV